MSKIVIALGGNALGNSCQEQKEIVKETAKSILNLFEQGHKIVITHGNGPQVGMINNAFNDAHVDVPFPESGAMSQSYIGFHIQNALKNEAQKRKIDINPITLITQTLVDENDEAFEHHSKPIGSFYTKEEAEELQQQKGWEMMEDAGRGWRKVIASPKPIEIIEKDSIDLLLKNDKTIVIAGGGGGIPVIKHDGKLIGVEAVIDKDATSSKLATAIGADVFMILTAVDKVYINFGKENQKVLDQVSLKNLTDLYNSNNFAEGSMKPKVKAIMDFVETTGHPGYIADLKLIGSVLEGPAGTKVTA